MAVKIPTFADLGFNDPRASTPGPTYPANDPGAEALGTLGKGVQALGGAVGDYAREQKSKENKINAALAGADLDGNLIRYADAAKNEHDPAKLDALRAELPGYLDRAGATITDPEARQLWAATHKIKIVEAEKVAVEQHRKIYKDSFLAGANQQIKEQWRLAAQASDPEFREQAKRNVGNIIGSLEAAGVIGSAKAQELMSESGEQIIIGTVNWLDANKDPVGAGKYLRDNLRHIDPAKAESLLRHLRPAEDREIGRAAKDRTRPGAGGGSGGGDGRGGWGPLAEPAIKALKGAGASDAYIQAQMAHGLAEGGFNTPWQKAGGGENSFGHWQFNANGELPAYLEWVKAKGGSPQDTAMQALYTMEINEQRQPGITKTGNAGAAMDAIASNFERYQGHGPGQRRGFLADAQRAMSGGTATAALADRREEFLAYNRTHPEAPLSWDDFIKFSKPGTSGVIDENTDPDLAAKIDAAPPAGMPVALDDRTDEGVPAAAQAGLPNYQAWVTRIIAAKARGDLTEEQADIAIKEIRQDQQQTMLGHENAEAELTLAVARGEKGSADVKDAYAQQRISPKTYERLELHIIDEAKKQALRDQAILRVSAAGAGGAPLDPKSTEDRKALNLHYDAVSVAWPAEETIDRGLVYSVRYGLVPTALQARIRGGLHSGRPELAIEAARTVNRLRNANPQLVGELGDENDLRLAAMISARDSMGVPPERALQMAVDEMKVPKAEKEARADDFDAQRGKTLIERSTSDTRWIEKQQNSMWVNDPNVDPQMRREFEDVAKAEFQKTGNLEAARRMSLDNINRVWGRSRVGGDNRYMKDAPEKFYGVPSLSDGENADWMNEQLLGDLSKNALQDPRNPIAVDRIKLFPDPTRRGEGGAPRYQVWIMGADSTMTLQKRANSEEPHLWMPDWANSAEYKRRQEGTARSVEEARKLRTPTLAPEQMPSMQFGAH